MDDQTHNVAHICFPERKKAPSTSSDGGSRRQSEADSASLAPLSSGATASAMKPVFGGTPSSTTSSAKQPTTTNKDEEIEDWCLTDVVFVEDGRTQPVGVLLKVDGGIAAVKFLKEQDRACLAARCPVAPVCLFINQIAKTNAPSGSYVGPKILSPPPSSPHDPMAWLNVSSL